MCVRVHMCVEISLHVCVHVQGGQQPWMVCLHTWHFLCGLWRRNSVAAVDVYKAGSVPSLWAGAVVEQEILLCWVSSGIYPEVR